MFTINESDGELADCLLLNDTKKTARSVSQNFKEYKFYKKETKPNAMKCSFKTYKALTAVRATKHTITTADGRRKPKKLLSIQ